MGLLQRLVDEGAVDGVAFDDEAEPAVLVERERQEVLGDRLATDHRLGRQCRRRRERIARAARAERLVIGGLAFNHGFIVERVVPARAGVDIGPGVIGAVVPVVVDGAGRRWRVGVDGVGGVVVFVGPGVLAHDVAKLTDGGVAGELRQFPIGPRRRVCAVMVEI